MDGARLPVYCVGVSTHRHHFAESIAESTSLTLCADPVIRELYGYSETVLDEHATMEAFRLAYRTTHQSRYSPTPDECEAALHIFTSRLEALR
jgi:hypothetical protein